MSQRTEKRSRTYDETVTVEVRCDLCGRTAPRPGHGQGTWGQYGGDVNEVTVSHRSGSSYPEGGSGETVEFDVCPDCFRDKLVPWLRSQGAEPRTTEWDH
jgi:hypothetical protein